MFVTLLVSQPPICALNVVLDRKRNDMSSMRDVSQPEIAPCVASAVASLAIQSLTAALSVALSSNTPFGGGGGSDGGGEQPPELSQLG